MKVKVEFSSKAEIGDRVLYSKQGYYAPVSGKILKIRFGEYAHEFEYLVEVEDGTREWKTERSVEVFIRPKEAYNNLVEAIRGTTK